MYNSWYAKQDYLFNFLIKDKSTEGNLLNELISKMASVHQIYCFKNICFVSNFPTHIRLNDNDELHSQSKPALEYKDGFSLYYSNGIEMKEEYILTSADRITKEQFTSEENADMRRELIRKIGINKVIEMLEAKTIDTFSTKTGGKYELLQVKLHNDVEGKFLKMKCVSTKNDHIIGVDEKCTTAIDAYCDLNNLTKEDFEGMSVQWEA